MITPGLDLSKSNDARGTENFKCSEGGEGGEGRSVVVGVTGFKLTISMCSLIR